MSGESESLVVFLLVAIFSWVTPYAWWYDTIIVTSLALWAWDIERVDKERRAEAAKASTGQSGDDRRER